MGKVKASRKQQALIGFLESTLDRLISCSHVITLTGKSYRALLRPDKALAKGVVTM